MSALLLFLSFALSGAASADLGSAGEAEFLSAAAAARTAFESGAPVPADSEKRLRPLSGLSGALRLFAAMPEIRSIQKTPEEPTTDPRALDALSARVRAACDALAITGEPRRAAVRALYLARWRGGAKSTVTSGFGPTGSAGKAAFERSMTEQTERGRRLQARLSQMRGAFGTSGGPGEPGASSDRAAVLGAPGVGKGPPPSGGSTGPGPTGVKNGVVPDLKTAKTAGSCDKNEDGFVKTALNLETCSNGGTKNRESYEGTKARICELMKEADYDPSRAWDLALAARRRRDADPGDLDLRNAEHYLYAYQSVSDPQGGIGDSQPVQVVLAVGWTPFKTITKYWRPTSTPSLDEMSWGVKGATKTGPDWRKECPGSPGASSRGISI